MLASAQVTLKAIRKQAGVYHQALKEELRGPANGSNATFYAENPNLIPSDSADTLAVSHVKVYVNDVVAAVTSVNEDGTFALAAAPPADATVVADYYYSVLTEDDMVQNRLEGLSWLGARVGDVILFNQLIVPADPATALDWPPIFTTALSLYCAGLILIQDYGSSADTDLTSKDGYKKMAEANKLITQWITDYSNESAGATTVTGTHVTDGNLFHRNTDLDACLPETPPDDYFFHKHNG